MLKRFSERIVLEIVVITYNPLHSDSLCRKYCVVTHKVRSRQPDIHQIRNLTQINREVIADDGLQLFRINCDVRFGGKSTIGDNCVLPSKSRLLRPSWAF